MDLAKILREAQADKPKQTRPNDANWQNNMTQFRTSKSDSWAFWDLTELKQDMLDFVVGKAKVEDLRAAHPHVEFRLVAILEVK